jgi:hypothetical protein
MLAIAPPVWLSKTMDKLSRGFLWAKDEVAPGGKCLVKWKTVCRPKMFGGLGIPNIQATSVALRTRWLWQSWTDPEKPWHGLPIPIDARVKALFAASVRFHLGDGKRLMFWTDRWHADGVICELAPNLFKACTRKKLTVAQAIEDHRWTRHRKKDLSPEAITEAITVWEKMQGVYLNQDIPDSVVWRWTCEGSYSSASAYLAQFAGAIRTSFVECIWYSDAPNHCRIFSWLAVQGRCLTADMLAKRGWDHPELCALCLS